MRRNFALNEPAGASGKVRMEDRRHGALGIYHDAGGADRGPSSRNDLVERLPMNLVHRILVATDFSRAARLAVTRAGQLASQYNAELQLVHAAPDWALFSRWTSARQEHYDAVTLHARNAMREEIGWVLSRFGVCAHGDVQLGRASRVIARAAAGYQPDLIVAGARGEHQPRISPEAFGGTTLKLLLHTDYPLLLVRGWDFKPYRVSIAAVHDACEVSRRVVRWGSSLVGAGDCHVIHAYEAPYFERTRASGVAEAAVNECIAATEAAARQIVTEVMAAADPSAHMHSHVVRGNPLGVLVTEIARYQPTLVVLGRRETQPADPAEPFGTEGLRMAYHCPVDTLVVP
jgi:nucleotide-binding universal stress UspA family protein